MTVCKKPTCRVVSTALGEIVVTLHPNGLISMREKGGRRTYDLSVITAYRIAVQAANGKGK